MTELRFPGHVEGDGIGREPRYWLVYNPDTGERRLELNPAFTPAPEPTELQLAQWAVRDAEHDLAEAQAWLREVMGPRGEEGDVVVEGGDGAFRETDIGRTDTGESWHPPDRDGR